MTIAELIAEFADWKLFLLAIFIYAICPQLVLRLIVLVYEREDPRRDELLAEVYAVPYIRRPLWVAEQLETAMFDGVWPRFMWSLTGRVINRWRLTDGDQLNRDHPESFWVPSPDEKAALQPGDIVKPAFNQTWPGGFGERMWVVVTKVGPEKLEGRLRNQSVFIPRLGWDETIKFERKHIIDMDVDDGEVHDVVDAEEGDPSSICCASCADRCNEPDVVPEHEVVEPARKGQSCDSHKDDQ